ncbi:DUF1501 domain-containing protein [Urbifossiella limnaea]|uniref:DUF1501 domain-containing protein n=1 Tax=Urbifossiella limnaea TaxID=2528023 RepID=A0A517Y1C6_9BACT|nr:DUF1501 domain-containing protein [Urbifossiella limnaea]QDU23554.1 hypothetical protein ETAA1_55550 [Urbifossiella limnaea]
MISLITRGDSSRREFLTAGGLTALGLTAGDLTRLRAAAPAERPRATSCVFLFLFGGPSQIDLWDMKPGAPDTVRGEFTPTRTAVPGVHVCEHLPGLGRVLDRVCLVRSMTHRMNVHGPACSEVFSGRPYFTAPVTDQASREDWPALSAMVTRYGREGGAVPRSVVLPWYLQFPGQPKRIAGQTGGRMGERHNAFLVDGDLGRADFAIDGLDLPESVSGGRLRDRRALLDRLERGSAVRPPSEGFDGDRRAVFDLLGNRAGAAFDLGREPARVREAYGRTTVGQSLLLARRLVEAGVSLVTVNWQDETKVDGTNTCWDTHQDNFAKLKTLLCPTFDRAFPAFVEDLHARGLLETTLVVAVGEFGRTPKLGQFTQSSNTRASGRDHWPHAFTALLAGGGVAGGRVHGATTRDAGYVADAPVTPADLAATILRHLGIDPARRYEDEFQRLHHRLSDGDPIGGLG